MRDFEEIKDSVICKVVNTEYNQDILKDRPHIDMEDMSATFAILISEGADGRASIPISNDMMQEFGVDVNTLMETSKTNMEEQDFSFKSMRDVLVGTMFPDGVPENDPMLDMMLPPDDFPMYVLTNSTGISGASEIFNENAMNEISEKFGGDFIVIPSSIHETLVLPLDGDKDSVELNGIIQDINSGVLDPKDKLSDYAFQYDSEEHELVRMDKMQERQQEKAENKEKAVSKVASKEEKPKKSLMDRISDKKVEAAKKEATRPQHSKQNKRDAVALT